MISTIPDARTALIANLAALTATGQPLEGVRIIRSGAWETVAEHDVVTVLNAEDIDSEWRVIGGQRLDEAYTIPVRVESYLTGRDLAEAETRAWEIATEIGRSLMTTQPLTLGGTVRTAKPSIRSENSGPTEDTTVLAAVIVIDVACDARVDLNA